MKNLNRPIGLYLKRDSIIHKLDPRIKILALILYSGTLIFVKGPYSLIQISLCLIPFLVSLFLSKIPMKIAFSGFSKIFLLMFILIFFNIFTPEGSVVLEISSIKISTGGLLLAFINGMRFLLLYFGSMLISYTTSPKEIMNALYYFIFPLKKFSFPVEDFTTVLLLAIRFIPVISEEFNSIYIAQKARGAALESKNIMKKMNAYSELFIPLIVSVFKKADEISLAMESRCYGLTEKHNYSKNLKSTKKEKLFLLLYGIYNSALILL